MSRNRITLVLSLLFVLLWMLPMANYVGSQEKHEEVWKFVQTVQDILAGNNREQAKAAVTPGARLVSGSRFENLRAVVAEEIEGLSLADTSYQGVMMQLETNPSEDAGVLVLKTQKSDTTKVRFHTVVFMKDSTGHYQIHAWHAGG